MSKTTIRNVLYAITGGIFIAGLIIAAVQIVMKQIPIMGGSVAVLGFLALAAVAILQAAKVF